MYQNKLVFNGQALATELQPYPVPVNHNLKGRSAATVAGISGLGRRLGVYTTFHVSWQGAFADAEQSSRSKCVSQPCVQPFSTKLYTAACGITEWLVGGRGPAGAGKGNCGQDMWHPVHASLNGLQKWSCRGGAQPVRS